MIASSDVDRVRGKALDGIAKAERTYKALFGVAAGVEAFFLAMFLVLMDFHDRGHWLLLVAAGLVYFTLSTGLAILGSYTNLSTLRMLKAVELLGRDTHIVGR